MDFYYPYIVSQTYEPVVLRYLVIELWKYKQVNLNHKRLAFFKSSTGHILLLHPLLVT